ncbi:MAG: hypothetical protein FWH03_05450 [Firmicutes bacterium]|nr:hypothetical protein [Bacillota bacterium]
MENKEIYIVIEDSVYDSETSFNIEGFVKYDDAVKRVEEILEQDKKENPDWYDDDSYVFAQSEGCFEVYEDGSYCENHLSVYVKTITLK